MRINRLYSSKRICEYNKRPYNEALHNSSFNQELMFLDFNETNTYKHNNTPHNNYRISDTNNYNNNDNFRNNNYKNKNRHRKIMWFNPSFL